MQTINWSRKAMISVLLLTFCASAWLLSGCASFDANNDARFSNSPTGHTHLNASVFSAGETVTVSFSGLEVPPPNYEERIKEDGTLTMPLIGKVVAAGKSPGDLQKELQEKYNKFYRNITVTVRDLERYFYVDGEVKSPGPKLYLGDTDIVKAITAGGGFTDFAKKTKVRLTRDGRTQTINWVKAVEDSRYNVPVYPGDQIVVPRRLW